MKNFDIFSNVSIINNFSEVLNEYIDSYKKTNGGRKRYIPLKFSYRGKDYQMDFNRLFKHEGIFRSVIDKIETDFFNRFFYFRNSNFNLNYEKFEESNLDFNEISGFEFDGEKIIFVITEDNRKTTRENIVNKFEKFKNIAKSNIERAKSAKPDFTNYMISEDSVFTNEEEIKEYLDLLEEYKDELKLNQYSCYYFEYDRSSDTYSFRIPFEEFSKEKLFEEINKAIKLSKDAIGIIPLISDWESEYFFGTSVLSFKVVYNDNYYQVKNHLDKVRGEAISRYYEEKGSGGYCGD